MGVWDRDYSREGQDFYEAGGSASFGRTGRPWNIVSILIAVNVGVFVLQVLTAPRGGSPVFGFIGRWGAMHTGSVLHGQIWRLITSQYLHADGMHILFNMIGLYFLGRPLAQLWSDRKFLVIYTLSGLAGNLFYMLLGIVGWLADDQPMVGASGCVLGLLGICAVMFPNAKIWVYMLFPIKIRTAAIVFAGLYILNLYQQGWNAGGDAAHLAGLGFGAWWAWKGDRWWARRSAGGGVFSGSNRPRKTTWDRKVETRRRDAELIDELLKKVHDGGIQSLSRGERKALEDATERARRHDREVGRVDRL